MSIQIPLVGVFYPVRGSAEVYLIHHATLLSPRNEVIAATPWGSIDRFELNDFKARGFAIVRSSLQQFARREVVDGLPFQERPEFAKLTAGEKARIKRGRIYVAIFLGQQGELWIDALPSGRRVKLELNADSQDFIAGMDKLAAFVLG